MARSLLLPAALSAALAVVAPHPTNPPRALPEIAFNENLAPAGQLSERTLTVALEIIRASWHPMGADRQGTEVLAFQEAGHRPTNPGPMLRVPLGTEMRVTITNRTDTTLAIRGLTSRRGPTMDSLLLAPGAAVEARFVADAEGTFYYWAGEPGRPLNVGPFEKRRLFRDSQLSGAFIVDPPEGPPSPDRIFVIQGWMKGLDSLGGADFNNEFFVVNGRPWPHTERLTYEMGDSVRWRIINASADVHPLHLHGFYFRVDSRGDASRDTVYWTAQRRMVVTERVQPGTTMAMAWMPDRPGGWVFHCHLTFHIVPNPGLGSDEMPRPQRDREVVFGHDHADPQRHVEQAMGGLMMGLYVRPPAGWRPDYPTRRTLRLLVQTDSTPADTVRRFGYVLHEGSAPPARDSVESPGTTLVIHRGEPTSIWVINHLAEPTAIHWHGIELESYFDGVVGVGGLQSSPSPTIMPGDSFEVRMTPPRAGSFMYHTHVNDIRQLRGGLWGPLLVVEPGAPSPPARDLVFITGEGTDYSAMLNGNSKHLPIALLASARYRIRLMNVTAGTPNLQYWLVTDSTTIVWRPLARDGFDLPPWQRAARRAEESVSIGQTADFEFTAPAAGPLVLEARTGAGELLARQPFLIRKP